MYVTTFLNLLLRYCVFGKGKHYNVAQRNETSKVHTEISKQQQTLVYRSATAKSLFNLESEDAQKVVWCVLIALDDLKKTIDCLAKEEHLLKRIQDQLKYALETYPGAEYITLLECVESIDVNDKDRELISKNLHVCITTLEQFKEKIREKKIYKGELSHFLTCISNSTVLKYEENLIECMDIYKSALRTFAFPFNCPIDETTPKTKGIKHVNSYKFETDTITKADSDKFAVIEKNNSTLTLDKNEGFKNIVEDKRSTSDGDDDYTESSDTDQSYEDS